MKIAVFIALFFLSTTAFLIHAFADMKDLLIDKKEAYIKIIGESKLFSIESAVYNTAPQAKDGTNFYKLSLKVNKNEGKATFTFVRQPDHQEYHIWEEYNDSAKEHKPQEHFQKVILKVSQFKANKKSFKKEIALEFDLIEPEEFVVHPGQLLKIKWHGDGGWGSTGYHLYSYSESTKEADSNK